MQTFFRDGFPYLRQPAAVVPSAPGAVVGAADELPVALVVRVAVALPLQAVPKRVLDLEHPHMTSARKECRAINNPKILMYVMCGSSLGRAARVVALTDVATGAVDAADQRSIAVNFIRAFT